MLTTMDWEEPRRPTASEPPVTYRVSPEFAASELDYTDMVALSGMFRRWAIHETDDTTTPEQRTRLIQFSADYERLAEWVGPEWKASYPSPHPPLTKFLATLERSTSNVTDFMEARRILRGR
jgi:hypothetical protein